MLRPVLNVLKLQRRLHLFEQLRLEESLLRGDRQNWCILNAGTEPPAIVMGVSGVPGKLLDVDMCKRENVRVIRRFSGGGTVVVDSQTLFVSLILNKADVRGGPLYPREVMRWTAEDVYGPVLSRMVRSGRRFHLHEHDYCLDEHKFAGNAQSISRERWVHHTSFLWDYSAANMRLLQLPEKRPDYRQDRDHADFLVPLKDHLHLERPSRHPSFEAPSEVIDDGHDYHQGAACLFPALLEQLGTAFTLHEARLDGVLEAQRAVPAERIGTVDVEL